MGVPQRYAQLCSEDHLSHNEMPLVKHMNKKIIVQKRNIPTLAINGKRATYVSYSISFKHLMHTLVYLI